jgi:hypothetical protein
VTLPSTRCPLPFSEQNGVYPRSLSVSVEQKADGASVAKFAAYALALMAARERGGRGEMLQEAERTTANSDQEAHAEGVEMARQRWPPADGWSHHQVAIRKVNVALDLQGKQRAPPGRRVSQLVPCETCPFQHFALVICSKRGTLKTCVRSVRNAVRSEL